MKNKFTVENAAMLLIDHQQGTIKLARNRAKSCANTRALAHGGRNQDASYLTSSRKLIFKVCCWTICRPSRRKPRKTGHAPGIVDCWEYEDFKSAVEAGQKKS